MTIQSDRCRVFHELHASGCFVIPNPWDVGSARALVSLGFKASRRPAPGSRGRSGDPTTGVPLDGMLAHCRAIAAGVDVPVSADFEGGFAIEPERVAENVSAAIDTGIAGLSIEDSTGDRRRAALRARAGDRADPRRAASHRRQRRRRCCSRAAPKASSPDDRISKETIARLIAYAEAGADCLHAPGLQRLEDIAAVVTRGRAEAGQRAGVEWLRDGSSSSRISACGGSASAARSLAAAWTGFLRAAKDIAQQGTFTALGESITGPEMNRLFR